MNKKSIIILVVIIGLYLFISFFINFLVGINKIYLVFPDNINLKYEKKWEVFTDEKTLKKSYKIIDAGNSIGSGKLTFKDGIMSSNNIELQNDTIAYRGTKIGNIPYKNMELSTTDYQYISNILISKNIHIDTSSTLTAKYEIDLNGDTNLETIYSISNNYDTELGKLFSIIIVKENNQIIQYNEFGSEYESYVPYIYFVDLNKDKNADMIIKNVYSSLIGQDIKLLSFKNDLSYEYIFEEEIR